MNVLLVEDDMALGNGVRIALGDQGMSVVWVRRMEEAARAVEAGACDLVVLDLGLPDGDGLSLLRSKPSSFAGCAFAIRRSASSSTATRWACRAASTGCWRPRSNAPTGYSRAARGSPTAAFCTSSHSTTQGRTADGRVLMLDFRMPGRVSGANPTLK